MTRPILVPVDGSPLAEHAVPWALAVAAGSPVHLVQIHVPPTPIAVEGIVVSDPTLDRTLREQEGVYLSGLANRVQSAAPGVVVESRTLESDDPLADRIAQEATACGAGMVVMSTHGRGAFGRFWLGSVTDDTVRVSPAPVLVIHPPSGTANFSQRPRVSHLVVPLDGSALAEAILPLATALARSFHADVTLLLVQEPGTRADGRPVDEVAARLSADGMHVTTAVREGSPGKAIVEYAKGHLGSAIALATHGRTGFGWLLNGSVADEVIHHAVGPVLVFHPPTA